jgi:hypothetical protein
MRTRYWFYTNVEYVANPMLWEPMPSHFAQNLPSSIPNILISRSDRSLNAHQLCLAKINPEKKAPIRVITAFASIEAYDREGWK